jgi:hypothetical protein
MERKHVAVTQTEDKQCIELVIIHILTNII